MTSTVAAKAPPPQDTRSNFLLGSLSLGHMSVHWFQQLWPVVIPSIKSSLGLSDVQLGTLVSVKQFTTGPLMLPAGILADLFRKQTAMLLGGAMLFFGISYMLVGLSPTYIWLLPTVALLGIGTALWHPAAMATLSRRFPDRRGSALAVHGMGASIGDSVAPLGIGALLLVLGWRSLLELQMIPALILALIFWRGLGSIYRQEEGTRPALGSYWTDLKELVRHRVVMAMAGVNVFTGMARLSVLTFLPVYLQEDLGYSTFELGFYITLLHVMGIASQPALGYLSDRIGRKTVLLPSLVLFGLLYLAMAAASPGIQLSLVIGALGLFFYALATVIQATVMDVASDKVQASTMGVTTLVGQLLSLPSPIIAGVIVTAFGIKGAFVYAGIATLTGAALLAVIHVPRSSVPTSRISG